MNIDNQLKEKLIAAARVFFISTTFICILCGIFGCTFFEEQQMSMGGFFSPPLFGALSAILSFVLRTGDKKAESNREILIRQFALLCLIEIAVFGLNYLSGQVFKPLVGIILACSIAVVFILVRLTIYISDKGKADDFNKVLQSFKNEEG